MINGVCTPVEPMGTAKALFGAPLIVSRHRLRYIYTITPIGLPVNNYGKIQRLVAFLGLKFVKVVKQTTSKKDFTDGCQN